MSLIPTLAETRMMINDTVQFAIICAALKTGVRDAEFLESAELYKALEKGSPRLLLNLDYFKKAYEAWLSFHEKLESEGGRGNLTTEQLVESARVSSVLEAARTTFIETLRAKP